MKEYEWIIRKMREPLSYSLPPMHFHKILCGTSFNIFIVQFFLQFIIYKSIIRAVFHLFVNLIQITDSDLFCIIVAGNITALPHL